MRKPSENDPSVFAAKFINQTEKSVFLTGKAGTGKTTFLLNIIKRTHKRAVIVAPTGIAAINAGGVTIHSQFQLPFGAFIPADTLPVVEQNTFGMHNRHTLKGQMRLQANRKKVLQRLELLIIDEVSMLRADVLDAIDATLRVVKNAHFTPFGGVQVLFIGDLMQLPPVVKNDEWEILKHYYKSPFFFDAVCLRDNPPLYIELDKIYRQSDERFINVLNNLRNNRIEASDMAILNQYYKPDYQAKPDDGYITLTTHNAKANAMNETSLAQLAGEVFTFPAEVSGEFPEFSYPLDKVLTLKIGAQVMFIKNDISGEQKYFNGKLATVESIKNTEENGIEIHVILADSNIRLKLEKYIWNNVRYVVSEKSKEIEEESIGTFTQFPIKLAWAITVHKSQGLTFDRAVIDVGQAFAAGQIYVALSRLRSLDGLILSSKINFRGISNDAQVERYAASKPDSDTVNRILEAETLAFLKHSILKSYNFGQVNHAWRFHLESYNKSELNSVKQKRKPWADTEFEAMAPLSKFADTFIQQLRERLDRMPIDWQWLNARLAAARDYFAKEFKERILQILMHREKMNVLPKTKAYVDELAELEMVLYEQYQRFQKAAVLVSAVVENKEITRDLFATIIDPLEHFNLLQTAKNAVSFEKNKVKEVAADAIDFAPKPKKGSGDTYLLTLEMAKSGKTPLEIAKSRAMTLDTVHNHLIKLVQRKLIAVEKVMDSERIEIIRRALGLFEDGIGSTPVKEVLGEDFSYGEIRLVRAGLMASQ
jgi:hypothetical protein